MEIQSDSQPKFDTILNFGPNREYALDENVQIEQMQSTYIPKSEHLARLKFYRLENIKAKVNAKLPP